MAHGCAFSQAKFRSLSFNLKDEANPDLRAKVLGGLIPPAKLVRCNPNMASISTSAAGSLAAAQTALLPDAKAPVQCRSDVSSYTRGLEPGHDASLAMQRQGYAMNTAALSVAPGW